MSSQEDSKMTKPNQDNSCGTIFSPGGRLQQIEFAYQATRMGSTVVGVCGSNSVVLGIEKRVTDELQVDRKSMKIQKIDDNIALAYSGLTADARILIDRATAECQSHHLIVESPINVYEIARYIGDLKHKYTRYFGLRPFGVMCLIAGFDANGTPHLYQTEPSGNFSEWRANVLGRSSQTLLPYYENLCKNEVAFNVDDTIKMALKGLLAVTRLKENNIELGVLVYKKPMKILNHRELVYYANEIEQ